MSYDTPKPCPLCGAACNVWSTTSRGSVHHAPSCAVRCMACGIEITRPTEDAVVEAWNRRYCDHSRKAYELLTGAATPDNPGLVVDFLTEISAGAFEILPKGVCAQSECCENRLLLARLHRAIKRAWFAADGLQGAYAECDTLRRERKI